MELYPLVCSSPIGLNLHWPSGYSEIFSSFMGKTLFKAHTAPSHCTTLEYKQSSHTERILATVKMQSGWIKCQPPRPRLTSLTRQRVSITALSNSHYSFLPLFFPPFHPSDSSVHCGLCQPTGQAPAARSPPRFLSIPPPPPLPALASTTSRRYLAHFPPSSPDLSPCSSAVVKPCLQH